MTTVAVERPLANKSVIKSSIIILRLFSRLSKTVFQDLDNETLLRCDAESRRAALEDELEFLRQIQEQVTETL